MAAYQAHVSSGGSTGSVFGGGASSGREWGHASGGGGLPGYPGGGYPGSGGGMGEMLGDGDESLLGDEDEWSGDEDADGDKEATGRGGGGAGKKRCKGAVSKEDKDKANRDRNREHARNTRLRKKAYVAKLAQLVMDLSAQREALARERVMQATLERERHGVRQQVVWSVLNLHASGAKDLATWRTLLDDRFVCTMPITPFRSFKQVPNRHSKPTQRSQTPESENT
jgi:hypothetical protein